ncbi:MAG: aminodeoxychorismate synthase component I, partial [Bacteroides sp.]|nr:aminodeoxychorismate synthase component I [Bacteroides sp.]
MNKCGKKGIPFLAGINFERTEGFFLKYPLQNGSILFQVPEVSCDLSTPSGGKTSELEISPVSLPEYRQKFDRVKSGLLRGDSFLTNLTVKTPVSTSLSLEDIFYLSRAPYKICIPGMFVCFSPEAFIRINKKGNISTYPMKGTVDASLPDAEQTILKDFKETAEHSTAVDLLRNDLSMVATEVEVKRFRYVGRIRREKGEILQVSSEISGKLPDDYLSKLGDIVLSLLPAGSVSGAPKPATLQLIREAEQELRGYYTGVFCYFDGEVLDSAVMIRFIEKQGDRLFYRNVGGITVYS